MHWATPRETGTGAQPGFTLLPPLNSTLPVGVQVPPATVAVNITGCPARNGTSDDTSVVFELALGLALVLTLLDYAPLPAALVASTLQAYVAPLVSRLTVNGEVRSFDGTPDVAALVTALGLDPRKVAVERNLAIVPCSAYASTLLADDDRIEIVHFIGGG